MDLLGGFSSGLSESDEGDDEGASREGFKENSEDIGPFHWRGLKFGLDVETGASFGGEFAVAVNGGAWELDLKVAEEVSE